MQEGFAATGAVDCPLRNADIFVSTSGKNPMSRTILASIVIAGTIAGGLGAQSSPTLAADARTYAARSTQVDCWIGTKFGDQPGQLIRGWVCERQDRPAALA